MKLSADKSSYRANGLIAKDERHTKDPEDEQPTGKTRGKKNTKRWCKGKVGKEHQIVWIRYVSIHNRPWVPENWLIQQCKSCKKTFEYCRSQMGSHKCQEHGVHHEVSK